MQPVGTLPPNVLALPKGCSEGTTWIHLTSSDYFTCFLCGSQAFQLFRGLYHANACSGATWLQTGEGASIYKFDKING